MEQIHSTQIRMVDKNYWGAGVFDKSTYIKDTDGLITKEPRVFLGVLTADCIPLICYDPMTKMVGAVHIGWKGTVKLIARNLVRVMKREFRVIPQNLVVWFGPSIGPCCYEVSKKKDKRVAQFEKAFGRDSKVIIRKNQKIYLNLREVNKKILIDEGVKEKNIEIFRFCTVCHNKIFPSHYKEGNKRETTTITLIGRKKMIDFKNKKITIMGLGLLGRGVGDAEFLAREGADLIVTDLKPRNQLQESFNKLKKSKNIEFILGKHRAKDFKNRDLILRSAGVPQDSYFLKIARERNIPIEMDDSLFAKYCPCPIIGVTGTRGKTTTVILIYEILKSGLMTRQVQTGSQTDSQAGRQTDRRSLETPPSGKQGPMVPPSRVYLAGNIQGTATLPLLNKVKKNDLVVLELSSWQLQGWQEAKISPHIAVITNIYPDHLNYYKGNMRAYITDKKAIYRYQTKDDYLILNKENRYSEEFAGETRAKIVWFSKKDVPQDWGLQLLGEHNLENVAAAIAVAKVLKVTRIKPVIENFKGIEHRLEFVREVSGVRYINDTTSTTPIATQKALQSFEEPIILIAGGSDKGLDFRELAKDIKKKCKALILLKGQGTDRLKKQLSITCPEQGRGINYQLSGEYSNLNQVVKKAQSLTKKGDIVLFSPACTSFGMFKNEYDRGEKFKKLVKRLKK